MAIGLERVRAIRNLRVSENPEVHQGIACVMELVMDGGKLGRIGLTVEALQTLRSALIDNPPPAARASGIN